LISLVWLSVAAAHAAAHSALFIGNSFTQYNDPHALDQSYAALIAEGLPEWDPLVVQRWTRGGATLPMHLESATGEAGLNGMLYGDEAVAYDIVVLQDQSQIPGFPQTQAEWIQSRDAAVSLASIITERGGATRLFLTWGKRDGDPINPDRFPDFLTMQALLLEGYTAYAEAIEEAGHAVEVVPVGLAWQIVYEDHIAAGEDPLVESSLFHRLYAGDGSHPSRLGTYLTACVFYGALTGNSPVGLTWAPDTVTDAERAALQAAADRLVFPLVDPGDTGDTGSATDTGPQTPVDTGTDTDTGSPPPGGGEEDGDPPTSTDTPPADAGAGSESDNKDSGGCGCASAAPATSALAGWVFLVAISLRRTVRRSDPRTCPRSPAA